MTRLSIDIPINPEKIEPKIGTLRRNSTGNTSIQITQPKSILSPNYLRTSIGSCHDFCKYGMKRTFPVKPWRPVGRKLDKNANIALLGGSDKDQRGKKSLTSPKLMPRSSRQLNELLKPKTSKTNATSHLTTALKQQNQMKSSCDIRVSRNDAGKDMMKTSKTNKKSNFEHINSSSSPRSTPKVPIMKIRTTIIKNCVENPETEKKFIYESVPEKIIHVIEPKDENRNEDHPQESYNFTAFTTNQNQNVKSTVEDKSRTIRRSARVIIPEEEHSPQKKLKFKRGKILEIEKGNDGLIDKSLRRVVSDEKFTQKKNDNNRDGVLRHQVAERKIGDSVLLNTVIEERANKLVKIRKSKVKALVSAFESVINIQDS